MSSKIALLNNPDGLIGDFLGTIPVMQYMSSSYNALHVIIHPEAEKIFRLIPSKYNIIRTYHREHPDHLYDEELSLDISKAFSVASQKNLYMSQTHFDVLGYYVPQVAPKADLEIVPIECPEYDFLLAPFARSLPPQERWSQARWQKLVDALPHLRFGLLGTAATDSPDYLKGYNVTAEFDHNFNYVSNLLRKSKGVISVVTGISHLCFHLGVPNILLNNQNFTWGTNPEAINIRTPIPELMASTVVEKIKEFLDNSK